MPAAYQVHTLDDEVLNRELEKLLRGSHNNDGFLRIQIEPDRYMPSHELDIPMSPTDSLLQSTESGQGHIPCSSFQNSAGAVVLTSGNHSAAEPLQPRHSTAYSGQQQRSLRVSSSCNSARSELPFWDAPSMAAADNPVMITIPSEGQVCEVTFHTAFPIIMQHANENSEGSSVSYCHDTLPVVARLMAQGCSPAAIQSSMASSVEQDLAAYLRQELGPCWRGKAEVAVRPEPVDIFELSLLVSVQTNNSLQTSPVVDKIIKWFQQL